jgi:hypothetical protein
MRLSASTNSIDVVQARMVRELSRAGGSYEQLRHV